MLRHLTCAILLVSLVACSRNARWDAAVAEDFERTLDSIENIATVAGVIADEWSRVWSNAIRDSSDFNTALAEHAQEPSTKTAIANLLKARGGLSERLRRLNDTAIPDDARQAMAACYANLVRLTVYASTPTGNLSGYNQAVGELQNIVAAQVIASRALLPPPAGQPPPQKE